MYVCVIGSDNVGVYVSVYDSVCVWVSECMYVYLSVCQYVSVWMSVSGVSVRQWVCQCVRGCEFVSVCPCVSVRVS